MSVSKFQTFCEVFHEGQLRKYTNQPYIQHPGNVKMILSLYGYTDIFHSCIALGHDLLEDTDVTANMLFNYLNKIFVSPTAERIGTGIQMLTNRFTKENYPDLNRSQRSDAYNSFLNRQLKIIDVQLATVICNVKCGDIIDNVESIALHDPEFAKVWLPEKLSTLSIIENYADLSIYKDTLNLVNKNI